MSMQTYRAPLSLPGQQVHTRRLACRPCAPDDAGARRLLISVLTQAVRDAAGTKQSKSRNEARAWLLESGASWAGALNLNITQSMIEGLAAKGWPRPYKSRVNNGGSKQFTHCRRE